MASESGQHPPRKKCDWGLYVILDRALAKRPYDEIALSLLRGGARAIQLRDKLSTFEELIAEGRKLRQLTSEFGASLLVNDNPYLAREIDADGVHLGQSDMHVDFAREVIGSDKIIGLSTHNRQQALAAQLLAVDYIGVGPIYATTSKKSEWTPLGTPHVRWIRRTIRLPMVAIGGIDFERAIDVTAAGAQNVAVLSAIMSAKDIETETRRLREAVETARAEDHDSALE